MSTSAKISAPRGFSDILPAESPKWQAVESIARQVASLYHFHEIRTPAVESTDLFHRGVGETTDIVSKETFTFNDRGGESLTLRPEGTAGVVRAVIEAGLLNDQGARAKVFYIGSNFRYEKPQKGRLRQHHQFGAEAFGIPNPEQDVECIQLQMDFYARCGVRDLSLRLNSLGDRESKLRYRDALVSFLSPKKDSLSEDSQRRLTENPLRILDSKDPRDIAAAQGAPPASDTLSDKSKAHFDRVRQLLTEFSIPFTTDGSLVRGFDYYTDTLWEVTAGGLGAQNAIGGGGRYDNLVESLGGRPTPGVGFGSGLERLLIALDAQQVSLVLPTRPLIFLASQSDPAKQFNLNLLRTLRQAGFSADMDLAGRSMKAQLKLAERENATIVLVTGESELASQTITLKIMATREQQTLPNADLISTLQSILQKK
ncbi:MAG TPA: histidine--tRNA ligase [Tepidisphaeraceae bacterium]|jgi:histidyl-tRNA synthetase|nr:histidine--tRNA ligase [Tepidisphaeraceae bacterium]